MIRNLLKAANALTFSTMFLLLLAGCNKNTIIFEDGTTPNGSSGNEDPGNSTLVTFNASVEGRNLLRSMSPMNKGIQSRVYVFDSNAGTKGSPEASGLYITSSPGVLTGSDGYKMFLSNGTYNFYAVSDNFSTIPPTFTSGVSEPLFNGIDYLWWSAIQQDVNSSQINIPIVYGHVATQVVVELTGGEGITINQLVSAMITPPVVGATMDLGTGVITPATAFGKAVLPHQSASLPNLYWTDTHMLYLLCCYSEYIHQWTYCHWWLYLFRYMPESNRNPSYTSHHHNPHYTIL